MGHLYELHTVEHLRHRGDPEHLLHSSLRCSGAISAHHASMIVLLSVMISDSCGGARHHGNDAAALELPTTPHTATDHVTHRLGTPWPVLDVPFRSRLSRGFPMRAEVALDESEGEGLLDTHSAGQSFPAYATEVGVWEGLEATLEKSWVRMLLAFFGGCLLQYILFAPETDTISAALFKTPFCESDDCKEVTGTVHFNGMRL